MVDRTFSVTVTTSKPKGITVKSADSQNEITAKGDTSLYYSELAKKWATSPDLVEGTDYSAKMYAQTAKDYAEQGKGYLDSAVIVYNDFDNQSILTLREIATVRSESLEEFNVALGEGKDIALSEITDEKTLALNAIKNEKNVAIQEIDNAFAELGGDLSDVKIVADNIETVQTIGENVENILNKTVDVGDTLTSEAGTEAKVVNVGTKFAPVLEFTIPQGTKGIDGKDGKDGDDGGMDATYEAETQTLSFYSEKGNAFYPKWGTITGDITSQDDLKTALDSKLSRDEVPDIIPDMSLYVKNTDYASDTAGVIKISGNHGWTKANGYLQVLTLSTDKYVSMPNITVISKGTLNNILTQYSKTVPFTEADYEALQEAGTLDANTLYLIKEE